jgi:hypothetical protein
MRGHLANNYCPRDWLADALKAKVESKAGKLLSEGRESIRQDLGGATLQGSMGSTPRG